MDHSAQLMHCSRFWRRIQICSLLTSSPIVGLNVSLSAVLSDLMMLQFRTMLARHVFICARANRKPNKRKNILLASFYCVLKFYFQIIYPQVNALINRYRNPQEKLNHSYSFQHMFIMQLVSSANKIGINCVSKV